MKQDEAMSSVEEAIGSAMDGTSVEEKMRKSHVVSH